MVVAQQLPQTSRHKHEGQFDRGAVAVELAFVRAGSLAYSNWRMKLFNEGKS